MFRMLPWSKIYQKVVREETLAAQRVKFSVKFSGCPVKINLNEQDDGRWMVTSLHRTHEGPPVTKTAFYSHKTQRKLESSDKVRPIYM